jgi:hypothetical protein
MKNKVFVVVLIGVLVPNAFLTGCVQSSSVKAIEKYRAILMNRPTTSKQIKKKYSEDKKVDLPKPSVQLSWRLHPLLAGKFHSDYPDDIRVIVHDGGPRITSNRTELIWVRVQNAYGEIFEGKLMNTPVQLETVKDEQMIKFLIPAGSEHPVMVTDKYLYEREDWLIKPCDKSGFSELFDAPSDLIDVIFKKEEEEEQVEMFTSFCPMCGGIQIIVESSLKDELDEKEGWK